MKTLSLIVVLSLTSLVGYGQEISPNAPLVATCKDGKGQTFNETATSIRVVGNVLYKIQGVTSGGEEVLKAIDAAKDTCLIQPNYIMHPNDGDAK